MGIIQQKGAAHAFQQLFSGLFDGTPGNGMAYLKVCIMIKKKTKNGQNSCF